MLLGHAQGTLVMKLGALVIALSAVDRRQERLAIDLAAGVALFVRDRQNPAGVADRREVIALLMVRGEREDRQHSNQKAAILGTLRERQRVAVTLHALGAETAGPARFRVLTERAPEV